MPDDALAFRKLQFLSGVRTLVGIAAACRRIGFDDAYVVLVIAEARAEGLPEHGSVTQFALELLEAVSGRRDGSGAGNATLPSWMIDGSVDLEALGPEEVLLGGRWHIAKPEWEGLPGETALELDLTAALCRAGEQTTAALALTVDRPRRAVSAALRSLCAAGHIEACSESGDRWRLSLASRLSLEY